MTGWLRRALRLSGERRGWLTRSRPLLLLVLSIGLVTGLALLGVRAADIYVAGAARPVVWIAELQHAVDDEARIEVRVDLGTRIQPGDVAALNADGDAVNTRSALLRDGASGDPLIAETLDQLARYQESLSKEVSACEAGLYSDCNSVSSLLVQPRHAQLLDHLAASLQKLSDRSQFANFVGEVISSLIVLVAGILCAVMVILGWRRRELARKAEAAAIARSEARFRALLQSSFDVITIIGTDGTMQWLSEAVGRLFGYRPEEMLGRNVAEWIHPDDLANQLWEMEADHGSELEGPRMTECRVQHNDGSWRWVEMAITSLRSHPDIGGIVLNLRDTTERKTFQTQLEHQALHDPLTHLGNRAMLRTRLDDLLATRAPTDPISVLFIDLDGFKAINDGLGHSAGDELLISVASSLQRACRAGDVPTRLGGDEFAVLLRSSDAAEATQVAARLLRILDEPVIIAGREVRVGASIGIGCAEDGRADAETLLRHADLAMYAAKTSGKGHVEVYESRLEESVMRRLDLGNELSHAIDDGDLVLQYQPLVSLKDHSFHGVEALVRWKHKTRGMVPPIEFISMAEEMGLIVALGTFVLFTACRQMATWMRMMPDTPFSMSINVSSRQLREDDFIPLVLKVLEGTGLNPQHVIIEITESVLVDDLAGIRGGLEKLREHGIKIAIDDFGSGYSSLSYLRKLPCDIVKIDRAFVESVDTNAESRSLTRAIVRLLDSLDVVTVAEGIETKEQLDYLTSLGVDIGQGYLFAKPMDPELIAGFVLGNQAKAAS